MSKKLIFATGNEGKMKEIRNILGDLDYEILSMKEAGVDVEIIEDGKTFEENAIIKAKIFFIHFTSLHNLIHLVATNQIILN